MSLSLFEITVPVMVTGFGNMSKFLDRGRAYADEKGIAHVKLLNARALTMGLPSRSSDRDRTAKAIRWS